MKVIPLVALDFSDVHHPRRGWKAESIIRAVRGEIREDDYD
jgi:hypothetical protein